MAARLRFGVVGTGPWASRVHVPAASESERVELTAVLGRDAERTRHLVGGSDATPFTDLDAFLDAVDLVGFAVPPAVQAELAPRVLDAGKHVVLEKPVAVDPAAADALVETARSRGARSLVFFTHRFAPEYASWLEATRAAGPWLIGRVESYSSLLRDDSSPFHASAWRHERGALWDVGPHALAQLCAVLGRVVSVRAEGGPGDLMSLLLRHESGAQGSISVAADLDEPVRGGAVFVGSRARVASPPIVDWLALARGAYDAALTRLASEVEHGGASHDCDLAFGAHVTHVLAAAERAAASGGTEYL